jgi:hypothetical protein
LKYFISLQKINALQPYTFKMTTITLLPRDILSAIFGQLSLSKDIISFKEASIIFQGASNMVKLKIAYLNGKIILLNPTKGISLQLSSRLTINDYTPKKNCINANCGWWNPTNAGLSQNRKATFKNKLLGPTTFYWPIDLCDQHDYDNDPYGINFEYSIRQKQCHNARCFTRYIPYCEMCMRMYVNIGERNDHNEVPFISSEGINNL